MPFWFVLEAGQGRESRTCGSDLNTNRGAHVGASLRDIRLAEPPGIGKHRENDMEQRAWPRAALLAQVAAMSECVSHTHPMEAPRISLYRRLFVSDPLQGPDLRSIVPRKSVLSSSPFCVPSHPCSASALACQCCISHSYQGHTCCFSQFSSTFPGGLHSVLWANSTSNSKGDYFMVCTSLGRRTRVTVILWNIGCHRLLSWL